MKPSFHAPEYDVIVIGGGPSGASTAAIVAEYGHRVLVLEREKFPRYHVGESLIPFTFGPLQRLGLIPKMRASQFTKKYSVSFVQPDGSGHSRFISSRVMTVKRSRRPGRSRVRTLTR
jgi:flavin-dependent dehydrogenase